MILPRFAGPALALLLLPGCAAMVPDAERVDVQQGNLLAQADIDRLEVGQPRERVREIVGTPIMASPFRAERWDYVFFTAEAGREVDERQRLTLYFDDSDRLSRIVDQYRTPEAPLKNEGDIPTVDTSEQPTGGQRPGSGLPSPLPE